MNPNQGNQNWDMIINADCDRVLQGGGQAGAIQGGNPMQQMMGAMQGMMGAMQGGQQMGGNALQGAGGVQGIGGQQGQQGMNPKMQLQNDLQQAQSQGWQPSTPQLKMKIQQALGGEGGAMGAQQMGGNQANQFAANPMGQMGGAKPIGM